MFGQKPTEASVFGVGSVSGATAGPTLIARGVKVEGNFSSEGDVAIEGEVHGTLSATGLLTIGSEAKIKADVHAGDALIAGVVEGNVTINKQLTIKSTARITGDITCEVVSVESGALLMGKISAGKRTSEVHAPASTKRTTAVSASA